MVIRFICPECDDAKFHDELAWRSHQEGHFWEEFYAEAEAEEAATEPEAQP